MKKINDAAVNMPVEELAHNPKLWDPNTIERIARYFYDHPEDPYYLNAFLNLHKDGKDPVYFYNRTLSGWVGYWIRQQIDMGGYFTRLCSIEREDVESEVSMFIWAEFRNWDPDKYHFIAWLKNSLRKNASVGYRLVKEGKPFKQVNTMYCRPESLEAVLEARRNLEERMARI